MINLNSITPPPPAAENLRPFFDLLALLASPSATKKRLAEFVAASEQARALIAEAAAAQEKLFEDRRGSETSFSKMAAEKEAEFAARETAVAAAERNFEKRVAEQDDKIAKREEIVNKREAALAARERDIEQRHALVKQALA